MSLSVFPTEKFGRTLNYFSNNHLIQSPEIKALISQVAQINRQAANLIEGNAPDEDKVDKSKIENKCDYVPGKLVAGPSVSHGLNNSG